MDSPTQILEPPPHPESLQETPKNRESSLQREQIVLTFQENRRLFSLKRGRALCSLFKGKTVCSLLKEIQDGGGSRI